MRLSRLFHSLNQTAQEQAVMEILELNEKTAPFGLMLTPEEAAQMIRVRNQLLYSYGRVELGFEVIRSLIDGFAASPYINDENYVPTLNELQEIFYYLKNETEDQIGDARLVEIMRQLFDEESGGSLELLKSNLEEYAYHYRREMQHNEFLPKEEE